MSSSMHPKHSTGWRVLRLVSDRGGKHTTETPSQWGKHRAVSADEAIALIERRVHSIRAVIALRETRP